MTDPILMEDYFNPGFKTKPAVLEGSQTLEFWHGNPEEQAWEGVHLAGATKGDLAIVRDIDPDFLNYWKSLMDNPQILNLEGTDKGEYLTQVILNNEEVIENIKQRMTLNSKLMVFLPTDIEEELANKLSIPLHGSSEINKKYGTKSGIRNLSKEAGIEMPAGFICRTLKEAKEALDILENDFEEVVIKHDQSASGYFSKKIRPQEIEDLERHLKEILGRDFKNDEENIVIEGWVKSKASLCAHIEILENQQPTICAGWQQIIDPADQITYMGGGPLMISKAAFNAFHTQVQKLAKILKEKGAIGSFGPDFLITENDQCVLIELNARAPYTAFPLEVIKQVKGKIGNGFLAKHIKLPKNTKFSHIKQVLEEKKLFLKNKNTQANGVVPYNTGLLPWGYLDIVIMASDWEKIQNIVKEVDTSFHS